MRAIRKQDLKVVRDVCYWFANNYTNKWDGDKLKPGEFNDLVRENAAELRKAIQTMLGHDKATRGKGKVLPHLPFEGRLCAFSPYCADCVHVHGKCINNHVVEPCKSKTVKPEPPPSQCESCTRLPYCKAHKHAECGCLPEYTYFTTKALGWPEKINCTQCVGMPDGKSCWFKGKDRTADPRCYVHVTPPDQDGPFCRDCTAFKDICFNNTPYDKCKNEKGDASCFNPKPATPPDPYGGKVLEIRLDGANVEITIDGNGGDVVEGGYPC